MASTTFARVVNIYVMVLRINRFLNKRFVQTNAINQNIVLELLKRNFLLFVDDIIIMRILFVGSC